jgi:hypothetical protein
LFRSKFILSGVSWAMVCLFAIIWLNNIMFLHMHVLSDKTVIIHAHPFSKSDKNKPDHSHTEQEFFLLEKVTNALFNSPEQISWDHQQQQYFDIPLPIYMASVLSDFASAHISPRAPPVS